MKKLGAKGLRPASRTMTAEPTARFARVTVLAEEIFGDSAKASRWLRKPKLELGGATPLASLASETGARQVEDMLYRIDSGFLA